MKTLIRTAPAVVLAAAGVALAFPAIASALPDTPGEWDIGAYDQCVASGEGQLPDKPNAQEDHIHYCCINSGGCLERRRQEVPSAAGRARRGSNHEGDSQGADGSVRTSPSDDDPRSRRRVRSDADGCPLAAKRSHGCEKREFTTLASVSGNRH